MKFLKPIIPMLLIAGLVAFMFSCTQDDVQRPVSQYQVKYQVTSKLASKSDFYITYFNPKFSNLVSEYFDTIKEWNFQFTGTTFDHLYLEAYTVRDSALFDVKIFVNNELVSYTSDSCPGPAICDTNRASVNYTLQ